MAASAVYILDLKGKVSVTEVMSLGLINDILCWLWGYEPQKVDIVGYSCS